MISPHLPSQPDRFCRLFPPGNPRWGRAELESLATTMDRGQTGLPSPRITFPIAAGYTYFGQFIDHDLTHDLRALRVDAGLEPHEVTNHQTPFLDLAVLYGDAPGENTHLDEADGLHFRVGESFDLAFDGSAPFIANHRNLGNPILRQLHVLFLKLHNLAVDETSPDLTPAERFAAARRRVTRQYQWLVLHDFLPKICDPVVWRQVIENHQTLVEWPEGGFSIPVEFSQAAFRFGHSLVRNEYILSDGPAVRTDLLVRESFPPAPLPPERRVDWRRFFADASDPVQAEPAMQLDLAIVPALCHLPHHIPSSLPLLTLLRGWQTRLASGQAVAAALGVEPLILDGPHRHPGWVETEAPWALLREAGFDRETPLWYYVLAEAQLLGNGRLLGPVGSRIIAEVLAGSLRHDPQGVSDGEPAPWSAPDGKEIRIRRLGDLARLVSQK